MTRAGSHDRGTAPPSGAVSVWRLRDHVLDWSRRPAVMGILNLTPDSFYDASRATLDGVADRAVAMVDAGAELLDLGAESTRPGAAPVPPSQEQARLLPALEAVRAAVSVPLTIDTTCAETARLALAAGADGVNDVSGGRHEPEILGICAEAEAGLVLMHMLGEPRTMQEDPRYGDVVEDVAGHLAERAATAVEAGNAVDRVLVDPGIGFGKTLDHNLALLGALDRLGGGFGVLLGASRKSFIGMLTGAETDDRLGGSLAAAALAHRAGTAVVRVHDPGPTRQLLEVLAAADAAAD